MTMNKMRVKESKTFFLEPKNKLDHLASVCVTASFNGGVHLSFLYTENEYRNQGYGTELMKQVIDYYEVKDMVIYLKPLPFGQKPMSEHELRDWYEQLGFVEYRDQIMMKEPGK